MAWPLRRYFRLLWWTLCILTFIALPLTIWAFQKEHYAVDRQAWFIGGIFVILSMPISIYEIAMHTEYYTQPRLQKHVIRILLMVPIYAVDAWFALRFQKAREYLDPIRECYEAFVIYSFFAYLMAFLQDTYGDLEEHMSRKPQMQHMWCLQYVLYPWDMGTRFLWECKKGVLNYVILRPICTALAFITDIFNKYGEGQIDFKKSYVYLAAMTNFSQLWALYCLVMLYTAMHTELAPIRPLSKFVCIKAVVFVTFWQGIAIAILVYAGVIKGESWLDRGGVASGIQDFLICIEMFLAALAHAYAFPPRDYMAGHSKGFFSNVRYIFDLRDVVDDVGLVVEEHVSTATTAVVKVPQRAVKKAAQGLAKNTKKLFAGKGSSGKLVDEEEEAASKCALLGPASPPGATGVTGAASNHSSIGGAPQEIWRGSTGGFGERRSSSGGGSATAATEALLGTYGAGGNLGPLAVPQQHRMMHDLEPAGMGVTIGEGAPPSPTGRGAHHYILPPLPPSSASLGSAPGPGSSSAFNTLVTSALYHTRGGYEHNPSASGAVSGGGNVTARVIRRGSGGSTDCLQPQHQATSSGQGEAASYGEYSDYTSATDAGMAAGPGGSGVELPRMSGGYSSRQQTQGAGSAMLLHGQQGEGSGKGGAGAGGLGRVKGKTTEVSVRASRSAGGSGGTTVALLAGGGSSGDDSSYERAPGVSTATRRVHDE
ncbi:hypothetical protein Vafri_12839 [Volvox africanus]|uniref:Uncharacterized protein n=1 Tax=Volvox africanus TaxID=51714 RepID=A0A8J4BFC6_9CHLO|nr:hypothetical protein Vafri_12839 [Volvox africanus]